MKPTEKRQPLTFREVNEILKHNKPLIDTVGILTGILLLLFTAITTYVTQSELRLNQRQFLEQQVPVWNFKVDNDKEVVQLQAVTSGVRLEAADVLYPKSVSNFMAVSWPIDPPEHEWHVTMLRRYLADEFKKQVPYDKDYISYADRGGFPVCLQISYTHFGESRQVRGLYATEFRIIRTSETAVEVDFKDVHFLRYLDSSEDVQTELGKLAEGMGFGMAGKTK